MKRILTIVLAAMVSWQSFAQVVDTLRISTLYTTHVIFQTELIYADLSNSQIVAAKIVEQNKNMLAIKARGQFDTSASVSALESNGSMHTFVIVYDEHPHSLVIDMRTPMQAMDVQKRSNAGRDVSMVRSHDAPVLADVIKERQRVYHIGQREYDLTFLCEDIFVYSDNTYFVFSLRNKAGMSYEVGDATFVIESRKKGKRSVQYEKNLYPKGRFGTLITGAGECSRIAYSFDKITLTKDQVLKVYLYETGGQRNLLLTMCCNDINRARRH